VQIELLGPFRISGVECLSALEFEIPPKAAQGAKK
jgi:hypothetical protein